jgi:flagellar M-ring protein FliF
MEFLRKLLLQTQTHLKGLGLSQRLAIGSCLALIVVALLWLTEWAAKPELVPLLDQPMSAQELAPIQQRLDAQNATYKVSGSLIMVSAESRARLLAQLGQQRALPNDISIGFAKLMEDSSPWLSMEEQGRRWSVARSNELSRVLREFDGVQDARVLVDEKTRRTFGQAATTPTASVFVKMAPGVPLDKERVYAMASFVSRAVAGLDASCVAVTDATTGRSYTVPTANEALAFDDLEDRQKKEEYFANKIKGLLANIPGLLVAVHAELDAENRKQTKETFGKPVQLTDKTETTLQERGAAGGGPGVVPNTSRAVTPPSMVDKTEKSSNETTFEGKVDVTQTVTEAPRHGLKSLSASINVPRSYLAAIYKGSNKGKDPSDTELETASVAERDKIKRQVERALNITKGTDGVVVDWFHDDATVAMAPVMEAGSQDSVMALAKTYGSKLGMGALGVVSLFMMLMMVRKVSEGPVLPGEAPPPPLPRVRPGRRSASDDPQMMIVGRGPVGEAEVTEQLLVAKEVDERTVRTQQVVEQVNQLIREDPSSSVSILQRWIEGEKM